MGIGVLSLSRCYRFPFLLPLGGAAAPAVLLASAASAAALASASFAEEINGKHNIEFEVITCLLFTVLSKHVLHMYYLLQSSNYFRT